MINAIEISADLEIALSDGMIRIHGEQNRLVVDADSWGSLLKMKRFSRLLDSARGAFPPGDGDVELRVRTVSVVSLRFRESHRRFRIHPLGIIKSLFVR